MSEKRVRRVLNLLLIALLIALFTLPRAWLNRTGDAMITAANRVIAATENGGDTAGAIERIERLYAENAPRMRLFLNHSDVDTLGTAIAVLSAGDEPETVCGAANTLIGAVLHLKGIETVCLDSIF